MKGSMIKKTLDSPADRSDRGGKRPGRSSISPRERDRDRAFIELGG